MRPPQNARPVAAVPNPDGEIEAARQANIDAQAELCKLSFKRFSEIVLLSPRDQLNYLDDPALQPHERARLRDALAAELPTWTPPVWSAPRTGAIRRALGRSRYTIIRTGLVVGCTAPALFLIYCAWSNTGYRLTADSEQRLKYWKPDGTLHQSALYRDEKFVVVQHFGRQAYTRDWIDQIGYAKAWINLAGHDQD